MYKTVLIWDFVTDTGNSAPEPQTGDNDTGVLPNAVGGLLDTVRSIDDGLFGTGVIPNAVDGAVGSADTIFDQLF
jgi:hypothetical protein